MLDIVKVGDEVLREKTEKVTVFDNSLKILIDAMFETMEEAEGVGLAGPQVGVLKSLFVIEIPGDNIKKAFINPVIVETSAEKTVNEEGCLSIPGQYAEVSRFSRVAVQAQDETGRPFTLKADGLLARAIQHEYDHLEGRLFIDRLSEADREILLSRYEKEKNRKKKSRKRR